MAIERAVHRLAADDVLRAVIIEGAGGWFCAGSDIREWARATSAQIELSFSRLEAACAAIEELAVPVIAKVRGPAAGAGCQLALACGLRVLEDNASIGMPIAWLGILVSPMFTNRLAAHGGAAVAGDLLFRAASTPSCKGGARVQSGWRHDCRDIWQRCRRPLTLPR